MEIGGRRLEQLADKVGVYLATQLNLDKDQQEILRFGALTFILQFSIVALSLLIAWPLGLLKYTFVFLVAFAFLRQFGGGPHSDDPNRCLIMSTIFLLFCGFISRLLHQFLMQKTMPDMTLILFVTGLCLLCFGLTALLAPVAPPNKSLPPAKYSRFRKISLATAVAYCVLIISGVIYFSWWLAPLLLAFLLQGLSLTSA